MCLLVRYCKIVTDFCIWKYLFYSCPVSAFMPASLLLCYGIVALRQRACGLRCFITKIEWKGVFPNKLVDRIFSAEIFSSGSSDS